MNDRFKELQKGGDSGGEVSHEDIELGGSNEGGSSSQGQDMMNVFFQDVGLIKTSMSNIKKNIKLIEEKYVIQLNSVMDQSGKGGNEVQQLIDATNAMVTETRGKLDKLKSDTAAFQSSKASTATEVRIRMNMHGTLTQKFLEVVQEYQEVQTTYKNKYKEKVERQYKIAKPDATPDEIDDAMQSGDSSKIFANQILDTHLHQQAKNALAYIEARHKDIVRLEASIMELHQLFVDMAVLVDAQGELLNQIEFNVSQSVAYTADGVQELKKAVEYQKKSRKKMLIIIVILIIIIIVILAPTLSTVLKSKNNTDNAS